MNKKKIIIAIVLLIAGIIIFWKRKEIQRMLGLSREENAGSGESSAAQLPVPAVPGLKYTECKSYPVKIGCKGKAVSVLQRYLNKKHGAGLKEDGHFGPMTETALVAAGYGATVEKEDMEKMLKSITGG
ncbi:MAG: peptidoglycan-binding domain-containing protein [Bacteroidota bacterium]